MRKIVRPQFTLAFILQSRGMTQTGSLNHSTFIIVNNNFQCSDIVNMSMHFGLHAPNGSVVLQWRGANEEKPGESLC